MIIRSTSTASRLVFFLLIFFWLGATNHCLIEGCVARFNSTVLGQENVKHLPWQQGDTHQHTNHKDSQSHEHYQPCPFLVLPGSQVGVDFTNDVKSQPLILLPLLFLPVLIIFGLREKTCSVFDLDRCPLRFVSNQIAALIFSPNAPPIAS